MKRAAAISAVEGCVESGMVVGLGTGTTSSWVVREIGDRLASGVLRDVLGIATSERTMELSRELSIPLVSLDETLPDVTIDGADEISPGLALLKGRGGALLREKIVASAGGDMVIVADDSKLVDALGEGPLPVEVEPFGWKATMRKLASLGCEPELRTNGSGPFVTDGGHYTIDCLFSSIPDPKSLESEIKRIPGALECGLFVGLASAAFVARESGVEVMEAG